MYRERVTAFVDVQLVSDIFVDIFFWLSEEYFMNIAVTVTK